MTVKPVLLADVDHALLDVAHHDAVLLVLGVHHLAIADIDAGMLIAVFADDRRLRFRTAAPLPGQILKVVIGLALTMVIRTVLKQPLNGLFGGSGAATAVRYFVMVLFAGAVWPLTFPLWEKVGSRKQ